MADRLWQVRCAMCGWEASGPFYVYDHEHYCEACADDLRRIILITA